MTTSNMQYIGTFNFQGEVHTLQTRKGVPSKEAALFSLTYALAKKLNRHHRTIRAYFNGSKDNYNIKEVLNEQNT